MIKTEWIKRARCRGADTVIFMPDSLGRLTIEQKANALMYCNQCPVKQECLEYAMEYRMTVGIYGGMTQKERKAFRKQWKEGDEF